MAELVDASDSKSDSERSAGSIPARGTIVDTMQNETANFATGLVIKCSERRY
jgi:hypothetical protein